MPQVKVAPVRINNIIEPKKKFSKLEDLAEMVKENLPKTSDNIEITPLDTPKVTSLNLPEDFWLVVLDKYRDLPNPHTIVLSSTAQIAQDKVLLFTYSKLNYDFIRQELPRVSEIFLEIYQVEPTFEILLDETLKPNYQKPLEDDVLAQYFVIKPELKHFLNMLQATPKIIKPDAS
ncbi:MAG: hypothetical protein MUE53_02655 [Chitinophagales bacterium]|jgi:hypothetical protein|nr:hypothetical protein [Chitinophagales bacterium]